MKLRSSLGNLSLKSNKLTALLVTLSLVVALSATPETAKAQEKDNQSQGISLKDKYLTQLINEIQKEMKIEDEKRNLEENKESMIAVSKEFRDEVCFVKDKKEVILDDYLEKLLTDINGVNSLSKLSSLLDKTINLLNSLKQKTAVIGQEKVSAGEKEVSYDVIDTYLAKFTALKISISKKSEEKQSLDLLSLPSVALFLQQVKEVILKKENEYNDQIHFNDSLKQDYSKLVQNVYGLEKIVTDISTQLQEKTIELEINQQEFSTFESLGTNIDETDFSKKVDLMNSINLIKKDVDVLTDSLTKINADLVIKTNQIPVKEVNIDQNIRKLSGIQKGLLDEKNKQYAKISASFRKESTLAIDSQNKEIEKQMMVLKKSIDSYNFGIDSLTNVLKKINEQMNIELGNGENVIKQREIRIQGLLREHVKYSQELEKLYLMYKTILSQNKEAIIKLEQDNPFIKTDVSVLESEKEEMDHLVESLRVSISSKEKEKSETKDDARVIVLINELTLLYANLQRAETSLKQTQELLIQRKSFDNSYSKRKDQEINQIDQVVAYIDNNISASKHSIGAFVYGYYMQLKKMEIQNVSIKIQDTEKRIKEIDNKITVLQNLEKEKRAMIKKSTGSPSERLQKEKQLLVDINIIVTNINSLKSALNKDNKLLEEYNLVLNGLQNLFKEFALLAKEDLTAYLDFAFNSFNLKDGLENSNYPVPNKLPMDISDLASIEKLINYIQEAGLQTDYSINDIKRIYE